MVFKMLVKVALQLAFNVLTVADGLNDKRYKGNGCQQCQRDLK